MASWAMCAILLISIGFGPQQGHAADNAMLQGSDAIDFLEAQGVRFWCE